jgi:hypothetical protein
MRSVGDTTPASKAAASVKAEEGKGPRSNNSIVGEETSILILGAIYEKAIELFVRGP